MHTINLLRNSFLVARVEVQRYWASSSFHPSLPSKTNWLRMGLLSQLRPLATYTNATTEVIPLPEGGKVGWTQN